MKLHLEGLDSDTLFAAKELAEQLGIEICAEGEHIQCSNNDKGIIISRKVGEGVIKTANTSQFCRALALYVQHVSKENEFLIEETPAYDSLGVMIDCSRNAVNNEKTFRKAVRELAVMGYNTVQLYTEDTYEIEGRPYFGYMRGRYSGEELRRFDSYAAKFGIELVPCIQTLAHLGQAIRWNCMKSITDCNDILLAGEEETYRLIEDMFRTLSENFTSRRVNIGMDEAHMLGLGKYLDQNGYTNRPEIMLAHLKRVVEIAEKYGFKPMMWSDMFFRLAFGGQYYETDTAISEEVRKRVPENIELVYWDYYSEEFEIYDRMMSRHMEFGNKIVFAGGAWRWNGFTPANAFSLHTGRLAAKSCKKNRIKDVFITMWGDNGGESALFAELPALQFWAEDCFGEDTSDENLEARFRVCHGASYTDFMLLDIADLTPDNLAPGRCSTNPSKYLFYQDILMGLFDKHVIRNVYCAHYRAAAEKLYAAAERNPEWSYLFKTQEALCRVLVIKSELGLELKEAYDNGNREKLKEIAEQVIPQLLTETDKFYEAFRTQWNRENKIFGLEVSELRMGGLRMRILETARRINEYLDGKIDSVEELEQERLYADCRTEEEEPSSIPFNRWERIVTASVI